MHNYPNTPWLQTHRQTPFIGNDYLLQVFLAYGERSYRQMDGQHQMHYIPDSQCYAVDNKKLKKTWYTKEATQAYVWQEPTKLMQERIPAYQVVVDI